MARLKNIPRLPIYAGLVFWAAFIYPINSFLSRFAILAMGVVVLASIWQSANRRIRLALALMVGGCLTVLVLPSQAPPPAELRQTYIQHLKKYEGAKYVWGGESALGIDCSGLVRRAMRDALVAQKTPWAFRKALSLWWYDSSAVAMRDGYRQNTRKIGNAPSINEIDLALLKPGDLAVTQDGVHILAHLGQHKWIEADPIVERVLRVTVPTGNTWFKVPVDIVRWKILEDMRDYES
jgi:hypothetical protein